MLSFEPPPDIMNAGERPARVRTGAKTATKNQEREMLDKFQRLADDPRLLVPRWAGGGAAPFAKLERKLKRIQGLPRDSRRLRWAARGKHLWNGYAAMLLILEGGKVPSFASFKFQDRDIKFVYRTGTARNALVGVQHFDDPGARLLGYSDLASHHRIVLVSGENDFVAVPKGASAPIELLAEFVEERGVKVTAADGAVRCAHASGPTWRYEYTVPDVAWKAELCMDCVQKAGAGFQQLLEGRILGPGGKLHVDRQVRGQAFNVRPDASLVVYEGLLPRAFERAKFDANAKYESYSDVELAQWTKDELVKLVGERPDGYLLVGRDLWLSNYADAADTYADAELERRALKAAFALGAPRVRVSDKSLHKILEPYWKQNAHAILTELSGGLLKEQELAEYERLNPSEAITGLARVLGARQRFREFLQFDDLHPALDYLVTCLQIQRSGEHAVLKEKLHNGAKDAATRILTLSLARSIGEQATFEWQYAPHEKDAASFLDPFVKEVVAASPPKFAEALTKLAGALGVPKPVATKPAA